MPNKIAFITGASSGIGMAIAKRFASEGINLILNARRLDRLEKLKLELESENQIKILLCPFDIRHKSEVEKAISEIPDDWKDIYYLINNAGLASGLGNLHEGDVEDWEKMIDTNVKGLLYISRIILPGMVERKMGHVVNISSIAGKEVYANGNVYCASKFAVDALSRGMRIELSPHNVKVTSINPGAVETEFSIVRFHGDKERADKVYDGFDNLLAEDIADAAYYAISRPQRMNINEMIVMPTAQPVATIINRK
ncbi:MAG: SDR family NAD(P)-dependent oxidoreductase [Bacteroidia bacterium]